MTDTFHRRIRKSLADANLQSALDANAVRRIQVRKEAFELLPDAELRRIRAHDIRAEVIDHLDIYLEQFITEARENGMQVHQAADAAQAVSLVLQIAQQHGARLVAKSKSMVSEEIGLNHTLEAHGLKVVETDLGEYIVQLRGEPPSHIITPAVHLSKKDVGRLFEEKLGIPYTDEISSMTEAARKILREVFLSADIGVSGVNFGVAETGTICLVTNEGNGRMVTTIPKVHIALMGIERLVRNMDDLALMLSLLPRSATGQKLSVYTSLINSPRQSKDPDGPKERHIILVDNGRMDMQASKLREILYCIRCGSCLNACPVYREIGGHAYVSKDGKGSPYPGPVGSVVSPAMFGQCEYGQLARASSMCGACREACPVDIDLPRLLLRVRAGIQVDARQKQGKPNAPFALAAGLRLYTLAASHPGRFTAIQMLGDFLGTLATWFSKGDRWIRLPKFTGWGYSRDFPLPIGKPFRMRFVNQESIIHPRNNQLATERESKTDDVFPERASTNKKSKGIAGFAHELQALGGDFQSCSVDQVAEKVLEILRQHGMDQLLVWEANELPAGLLDLLSEKGINLIHPTGDSIRGSSQVQAGLTGASAGIADTGSLLLLGGNGKPLIASLLPEIHIAILWEKDICEELDTVLSEDMVKESATAVLVTGPSRTADIEMTLTIGLHGPGELHVLCISNEE